jgi:N-carbamoylputrescine amidase
LKLQIGPRARFPESAMIVTVCELPEDPQGFEKSWARLAAHVRQSGGGLVLLPDMALSPWFSSWEHRLGELGAALVLGSMPVAFGNERYNEGFVWSAETGFHSVHAQASRDFVPLEVDGVDIGFMIGPEASARGELPYVRGDVDIIAMPRCTRAEQFARRLECACAVATGLGAFALSSNRSAPFEGQGWIVAPDGRVLGTTSGSQPFVSLQLELPSERTAAHRAGPQPAPDWMDPLDTGVPNYDPR